MRRPLLWLLGGLALFLLAAALLAPSEVLLRGIGLSAAAILPAVVVVVLVADQRRRRGRTSIPAGDDGDE